MSDAPANPTDTLLRPWSSVERRIARERAARFRAVGSAATERALWATECELRLSPGYARARALDLEHHRQWRRLLDQIARTSDR